MFSCLKINPTTCYSKLFIEMSEWVCLFFPCRFSPGYSSREKPSSPPEHSNVTVDGTERRHDGNGTLPEPRDNGHGSSPVGDGTGPLQQHTYQPTRNVQYEHRNDPNVAAPKPKWHEHHTQPSAGAKAAHLRARGWDGEWFRSEHAGELSHYPAAPADERAGEPSAAEAPGPAQAAGHHGNGPAGHAELAAEELTGDAGED